MPKCENCLSEKVCRYNDGHNLYCKDDYECPHYKPTADVVEVVRCKDCKHRTSSEFCECRDKNDFCSDGERL